jgi:hypothetical protein
VGCGAGALADRTRFMSDLPAIASMRPELAEGRLAATEQRAASSSHRYSPASADIQPASSRVCCFCVAVSPEWLRLAGPRIGPASRNPAQNPASAEKVGTTH